ncbi:MAG: hypothetical protein ACR2J8_01740 [Thermomicrobiales bacterium]
MARIYYLAGAVLVVGYLALGELYLLIPRYIEKIAPGLTLLVTALAATLVMDAPVDSDRLASEGWRALEKGPALIGMAVAINAIGTLILAGGAFWSAWQFRRNSALRERMIGCVLIGLGALIVASGGSLTRLGSPQFLYIAMSAGVALIFGGYLQARKPLRLNEKAGRDMEPVSLAAIAGRGDNRAVAVAGGTEMATSWLIRFDADAIRERCLEWSATPGSETTLDRAQARQVWRLRQTLPVDTRAAFDALPVATRRQLAEVFWDVFNETESAAGRPTG